MSKYTAEERISYYQTAIRFLIRCQERETYLCVALSEILPDFDIITDQERQQFMCDHFPELWSVRRPIDRERLWSIVANGDRYNIVWFSLLIPDEARRVRLELLQQAIKLVKI